MKLQLFDGGLNTRLNPRLVPSSEALECSNVDLSKGVLIPLTTDEPTDLDLQPYAHYYNKAQEWVSFDRETYFLEFQNTLYYVRDGIAYKYTSSEERLGVVSPKSPPEVERVKGFSWTSVASNGQVGALNILVAVGNSSEPGAEHAVSMTSYDLGETWNVKRHEGVMTKWQTLAWDTKSEKFLAFGVPSSPSSDPAFVFDSIWYSSSGEDWVLDKLWTSRIFYSDIAKFTKFIPSAFTTAARLGWVLAERTNGVIDLLDIRQVLPDSAIYADSKQTVGAVPSVIDYTVREDSASTNYVLVTNGTKTVQRGGPDLVGTSGWSSYDVEVSVAPPYTSVEHLGWRACQYAYDGDTLSKAWHLISLNQIARTNNTTLPTSNTGWLQKLDYNELTFDSLSVTAVSGQFIGTESGAVYKLPNTMTSLDDIEYVPELTFQGKVLGIADCYTPNDGYYALLITSEGEVAKYTPTSNTYEQFSTLYKPTSASGLSTYGDSIFFISDNALYSIDATKTATSYLIPLQPGEILSSVCPVSEYVACLSNTRRLHLIAYSSREVTYVLDLASYIGTEAKLLAVDDSFAALWEPNKSYSSGEAITLLSASTTGTIVPVTIGYMPFGYSYVSCIGKDHAFFIARKNSPYNSSSAVVEGSSGTVLSPTFTPYFDLPFIVSTMTIGGRAGVYFDKSKLLLLDIAVTDYTIHNIILGSTPGVSYAKDSSWKLFMRDSNRIISEGALDLLPTGEGAPPRGIVSVATGGNQEFTALSAMPSEKFILRGASNTGTSYWTFGGLGASPYAYQWVYTYYASASDIETSPSPITPELSLDSTGTLAVKLTAEPSTDGRVTSIRFYRIGKNQTEFTLVGEVLTPSTSFIDYLREPDSGVVLTTDDNYPPPEGLNFFATYGGRFFSYKDFKLYFSDDSGRPDYWPPENYLPLTSEVTGLMPSIYGLYIFHKTSIELLTGQGPLDMLLTQVSHERGVEFFDTVTTKNNSLFFMATDGVYQLQGLDLSRISTAQLGEQSFSPISAVTYKDTIYFLLEGQNMLVLDLSLLPKWSNVNLVADRLVTGNGKLLAISNETTELFKGTTPRELAYVTPWYTEGASTELKSYNSFYIEAKAPMSVTVYIDGQEVITNHPLADGVQEVQIPLQYRRGHYISFQFRGTGEVYELEWVSKYREKQ